MYSSINNTAAMPEYFHGMRDGRGRKGRGKEERGKEEGGEGKREARGGEKRGRKGRGKEERGRGGLNVPP